MWVEAQGGQMLVNLAKFAVIELEEGEATYTIVAYRMDTQDMDIGNWVVLSEHESYEEAQCRLQALREQLRGVTEHSLQVGAEQLKRAHTNLVVERERRQLEIERGA